jgi:hypothetical protein
MTADRQRVIQASLFKVLGQADGPTDAEEPASKPAAKPNGMETPSAAGNAWNLSNHKYNKQDK